MAKDIRYPSDLSGLIKGTCLYCVAEEKKQPEKAHRALVLLFGKHVEMCLCTEHYSQLDALNFITK